MPEAEPDNFIACDNPSCSKVRANHTHTATPCPPIAPPLTPCLHVYTLRTAICALVGGDLHVCVRVELLLRPGE